jgi:hypothetical protein
VRKRTALLGLMVTGAVALGTVATAPPADAAPATSLTASANPLNAAGSLTVSPDSVGSVVCGGDLCIQRTTSIVNNKATVKAWARTFTFVGHFELRGPDGHIANSPTTSWAAGGAGYNFKGVAAGGGYSIIAWDVTNIGQVNFRV